MPICCPVSVLAICIAAPTKDEDVTRMQAVMLTSDLKGVLSSQVWASVDETVRCLITIQSQPKALLGCSANTIYIW